MKIGINLDGVLIDKRSFQYKYGLKYFGKHLGDINEFAYSFCDMFNCTKEEENDFWNKYYIKYYLHSKIETDILECLKTLQEKGYEIFIFTSKNILIEDSIKGSFYRYLLNIWLKYNNVSYDNLVYCNENNFLEQKLKSCMENKIDYMIEDFIPNSIVLSKICNVILYDRPYNIGYSYLTRINNFNEILNLIEKKEKEKLKK